MPNRANAPLGLWSVVRHPWSSPLSKFPFAFSRRARKGDDKTRQADRQESDGTGNPPACGRCRRISWADSPVRQEVSWSRGPVGLAVPMHSALSPLAPLSSPDSKWTGPFSSRFCCRGISSRTRFPKAGYANTGNSKWTERIDFWSILVHFEIGSVSHSSLLSLGLARAVSARNFTAKKKNFGKEKVKFWMLHQPLTSMGTGIGQQKVKKR